MQSSNGLADSVQNRSFKKKKKKKKPDALTVTFMKVVEGATTWRLNESLRANKRGAPRDHATRSNFQADLSHVPHFSKTYCFVYKLRPPSTTPRWQFS
jgi:hypothetical protein